MRNVSIVIPNWNGLGLLSEFLPSVIAAANEYRSSSNSEIEVVVVDDGSTDESLIWLQRHYGDHPFVNIVELENNVGFLRAVNKGFETAKFRLCLLLNNDVWAEPSCISPLVKHFDDANLFAVCCRAGRVGSQRLDGGGKIGHFERGFWRVFLNYEAIPSEAESDLISFYGSGGYTMYDRSKWLALGGFQDCLAPNYWEDVEICYRAWKRGWSVLYEPRSQVTHKGSATMSRKEVRAGVPVTTERNRLLFIWINLHDAKMLASHFFWLLIKLLGSVITFRFAYLRSFLRAIGKLSKVRRARRIEKKAAVVTDRKIQDLFDAMGDRRGFYIVENEEAEAAFLDRTRDAALGNN